MPLPKFNLLLLARTQLTGPDGPVDLPGRKLTGLLAYLACTAAVPQPREKLANLLWGSHFEALARQNLRQALLRLRRTLGDDALIADGDAIALAPGVVACDAAQFETLVRDGGRASLAEAAGLYKGRFLADIAIEEEAFADWAAGERQRLEELALDALVRLGGMDLALGHADQALEAAQRSLVINNLREDAHRLAIRALAGAGRKAEALKHYRDLAGLLGRELATEPDAATKALVAELGGRQAPIQPAAIDAIARPAAPEVDLASPAAPLRAGGPERRQLTVMVCNLAGAAGCTAGLDPEAMGERIAAFHQLVTYQAAHFEGYVAQYLGDGAHVYFGYPAAHEDDAEQAVRAGLAIRDAAGSLQVNSGFPLQARVGIATGLVVIGDQLGTGGPRHPFAIGETPNLAAELQAAASPGEVVIAAGTRRLVGRMFECARVGPGKEGLPQPGAAWLVRGVIAGVSRFDARRAGALTPLVGREEELELLERRWDQAKAGEGRVVLLAGEPGIGKSRLTQEFKRRIAADRHLWIECGGAAFFASAPFHAVVQMLNQGFGWRGGETAEARIAQLERTLEQAGMQPSETVPLIAELINLSAGEKYPPPKFSPDQRRKRLLATLAGWVLGATRRQPVVIVVEDLHWVDPSTLELLQVLVEQCTSAPLLLLATARPEFRAPWPPRAHHAHIALNRLDGAQTRNLVAGITQEAALADDLVDAIIERAEGVPLFAEELTRSIMDGRDGARDIPATLRDSLTARLDRLGAAKEVAQLGAVLGRDFPHELLAAVSQMPGGELEAALARLADAELVYRRGIAPDASYQFKHALVQDAAYQALLRPKRRELHGRVAATIAEKFPALAGAQPQMLARHWSEAGDAEKAIEAWLKAVQSAEARHAIAEAAEALRQVLAMLRTLPETPERDGRELAHIATLTAVLYTLKGTASAETIEVIARHRALAEKTGNLQRVVSSRLGIFLQTFMAGDLSRAAALADQLTDLVESVRDSPDAASVRTGVRIAHFAQLMANYSLGNIARAEAHFEAWEASPTDGMDERHTIAAGFLQGAFCAWHVGRADWAHARIAKAMAHGRNSQSLWDQAFAQSQDAVLRVFLRDFGGAEEAGAKAVAVAKENSLALIEGFALPCVGWAQAHQGCPEDGLALIRKGLSTLEGFGSRTSLAFYITLRAEAEALAGAIDDAFKSLDVALALNPDERLFHPHTLIARGKLRLEHGQCDGAEADFRAAIALSRRGGAKACEQRAAAGLARLMKARGDTGAPGGDRPMPRQRSLTEG